MPYCASLLTIYFQSTVVYDPQKKVRTSGDYSGSDEEEHDAYLEQMKAEGAEKNEDDSDSEGKDLKTSWSYVGYQLYFSTKWMV